MNYQHLTQDQRCHIYALKKSGFSQKAIAEEIEVSPSTISRELRRNRGSKGYRSKQAQELATNRKKIPRRKTKLTPTILNIIIEGLKMHWSPEQISGYLTKILGKGESICHETIYQFIETDKKDGGNLCNYLRCHKKKKSRYGSKSHDKRGQIPNKKSIEDRPKIVEKRERIGDWEGDLVIGKNHQGCIVTLVDRCSRKILMEKLNHKTAQVVTAAICKLLKSEVVHTITFDNGKEFAYHEEMAIELDAWIYFAHPYSSWERGTNENTNGLLREFFPKKSSFKNITDKDCNMVQELLNNRPRKILDFGTPNEVHQDPHYY